MMKTAQQRVSQLHIGGQVKTLAAEHEMCISGDRMVDIAIAVAGHGRNGQVFAQIIENIFLSGKRQAVRIAPEYQIEGTGRMGAIGDPDPG